MVNSDRHIRLWKKEKKARAEEEKRLDKIYKAKQRGIEKAERKYEKDQKLRIKRTKAEARREEAKSRKEEIKSKRQKELFKRQNKQREEVKSRRKQLARDRKVRQFQGKVDKFGKNLASAFGGTRTSARQPTPQQIMRHRERMAKLQFQARKQRLSMQPPADHVRGGYPDQEDMWLNSPEQFPQTHTEPDFIHNPSTRQSGRGFSLQNFMAKFGRRPINQAEFQRAKAEHGRDLMSQLGTQNLRMGIRGNRGNSQNILNAPATILNAPNSINRGDLESGRLTRSEWRAGTNVWRDNKKRLNFWSA